MRQAYSHVSKNPDNLSRDDEKNSEKKTELREKVKKYNWSRVKDAVEAIALCHNVTPTYEKKNCENSGKLMNIDFSMTDSDSETVHDTIIYQVNSFLCQVLL